MPEDTNTNPTNPVVAGTQDQGPSTPPATPVPTPTTTGLAPNPIQSPNSVVPNKSKKKLFVLIFVSVLVIFGGSAGAYFGVVVPNKPENVLKSAVSKAILKTQDTGYGKISLDFNGSDVPIKNITGDFKLAIDTEKKAYGTEVELSTSGVKLPLDFRMVEDNIYVKVGDLGSIKGAASLAGGSDVASIIDSIGNSISDQWIEIDSSLLKQAQFECVTDAFVTPSKSDMDKMLDIYSKHSFATIKSTSSDKIDGKNVTRYNLGLDFSKIEAFSQEIESVESFKSSVECGKQAESLAGDEEVKTDDYDMSKLNPELSVWIDGGKNLKRFELKLGDEDFSLTFAFTFTDEVVDIQKPEGAKPLMEVVGSMTSLFGGFPMGGGIEESLLDSSTGMSSECEAAFQSYITSGGVTALPQNCF